MEEIWKDIYFLENNVEYDYRGLYKISNFGNIKSLNCNCNGKEKILKQYKRKDGYCDITLCKNGKTKSFLVHRLVAYIFIKNDDQVNKTQVNHKDENKENNYVENLEWCTPKYNSNYGNHNKKLSKSKKGKQLTKEHKQKISNSEKGKIISGETRNKISESLKKSNNNKGKNHSRAKKVVQYNNKWELLKIWNYAKEAGIELGISPNNITNCCKYYENEEEYLKKHKQSCKSAGKDKNNNPYYWKYYKEDDING